MSRLALDAYIAIGHTPHARTPTALLEFIYLLKSVVRRSRAQGRKWRESWRARTRVRTCTVHHCPNVYNEDETPNWCRHVGTMGIVFPLVGPLAFSIGALQPLTRCFTQQVTKCGDACAHAK
eukprot:868227-Pleurochrysis_carterae.AAC.3